ncbi:imidazolonepropionase-like domain-containing protein [Streptomyces sp. NPDC052042]|uniref:imidazolonepropionase-like domain-containing protein n=1 Tax=Streptomyces sp. NPDC052042 TaxID=3365683 RepID=UPI0037D4A9F9
MLTVHTADAVHGAADAAADSVAVDGAAVVAIGPYEELTAAHPAARVRRWSGLITPGLLNARAPALLEAAYHPDPREADELGTEPLTGAALTALGMDETRWGASARRGLQRMLRHGTTAVRGPFARPAVRTAVARSGLHVHAPAPAAGPVVADPLSAVPEPTGLDPLASVPDPAEAFAVPLTVGGPADLAVFAVADMAELAAAGAGSCVATVLGGRLVFRRG